MKRNVTITLDEETARWTRIEAARRDTSVSSMVGELLRERMLAARSYDAARTRFLARKARPLKKEEACYPTRDEVHDRSGSG